MRLSRTARRALLALGLANIWAPAAQAEADEWSDKAWIRKYLCEHGSNQPNPYDYSVSIQQSPYFIGSFYGAWDDLGDSARLLLDILVVYNDTRYTCDDINLNLSEGSLAFETLGSPVGRVKDVQKICPLPKRVITGPDGSVLKSTRLSSYHVTFDFARPHKLQTLVSTLSFTQPNGTALDCGVAKITPDLGKSASWAVTVASVCVLTLGVLAAWRKHLTEAGFRAFLDRSSILERQGPVWAMVLDITVYLRYFQFIFLSASMTMEYPGFFVPVVSKLSWTSLLFWRGPFAQHSYPGIEGGMYVSNSTYGPDFMNQMLGYPSMIDTTKNSAMNLVILVTPVLFILSFLFIWTSRSSSPSWPLSFWSIGKKAMGMTIGLGLCFFSVPILSYLAYDLILIGYLSNARVALAIAMLLIIVVVNYFFTVGMDQQIQYGPMSKNDIEGQHNDDERSQTRQIMQTLLRHLPHSIHLIQAICIGSLQYYPVAQVSVLAGCELISLVHNVLMGDEPALESTTTYTALMRLVTAALCGVFISSASEATRQWIGYVILGLHGFVALPGLAIKACWQLYRTFRPSEPKFQVGQSSASDRQDAHHSQSVRMDTFTSPSTIRLVDHRGHHSNVSLPDGYPQDNSIFYRTPRSRSSTPVTPSTPSRSNGSPSELPSATASVPRLRVDDTSKDGTIETVAEERAPHLGPAYFDRLSRSGVDYSFREVDLYYQRARTPGDTSELATSTSGSRSSTSTTSDAEPSASQPLKNKNQKFKVPFGLSRLQRKEPEKGFEVVRRPRPPQLER